MQGFIVVGPENSGTRLTASLLIKTGCDGSAEHEQDFDNGLPEPVKPIVWRRSIPHGTDWPDITEMAKQMQGKGYDVSIIVTTRDWHSMISSQIEWIDNVHSGQEAIERIRRAYCFIFMHLYCLNLPYVISNYESLIQRPESFNKLLSILTLYPLTEDDFLEIYDGNKQYYES